jgi:ADP-ribose pyrophosphatase
MPIQIHVLEDRAASTPSDRGFIRVRRLRLRTTFEDGSQSDVYDYDVADRDALDAVLIALHSPRAGAPADPDVCLRTALRPPVALRRGRALVVPDARVDAVLWELPAGLIEPGAHGEAAVGETAARETLEEVGLAVRPEAFEPLGVAVYLSPGLMAEKLHVLRAEVDRTAPAKATATETVELGARVEWCPLSEALRRAAAGEIEDCKTELGLRRLRDWLAARGEPRA